VQTVELMTYLTIVIQSTSGMDRTVTAYTTLCNQQNKQKSYHQWDSVTCFRGRNNGCRQYTTKHYSNWIC